MWWSSRLSDMERFDILKIDDSELKSELTKEILSTLPEWFGDKEAVSNYAENVKNLPFWIAINSEAKCVGILSIALHYDQTGEVFVCGVLPEFQRQGIGKALYRIAENFLIENNYKYVIVKTLSDAVNFEPYEKTRNFYKSVGFDSLITLTEMWNEENPCLIMIKSLIK